MKINLVSLEDGITATGFRKFAAYVERLNPETHVQYVTTRRYRGIIKSLTRRFGEAPPLGPAEVDEVARGLADADMVAFSSMTGYSDLTKEVIRRVRAINPKAYVVWGGLHPIIYPEDAIQADVDAICTGEGELAFEELLEHLNRGTDASRTKNFWFKRGGEITRNPFRPLMTPAEMETLPFAKYGGREHLYSPGQGFVPVTQGHYLANNGLAYPSIWSIGCPLHCTFCGNTVFIANDANYMKIRHPSADYMVAEIKRVREVHPHVSSVMFFDDSFMAIHIRELEQFAVKWRREVGIPFSVYGVIPTYVQRDKFEVLTWAGMNRVRMGIQSGSERLLKFYKRPTPIAKVESAAAVISEFSRYHINPSFDIIVDNPIETRQDVVDTLELLYRLARPFTLNIFSLRLIPNTVLEKQMKEAGVDIERINSNYCVLRPTFANVILYLLTLWRPPRALFDRLLARVRAYGEPQASHPVLIHLIRIPWLINQGLRHLRFADFSLITGRPGYWLWRLGVISKWLKLCGPRMRLEPKLASRTSPAQEAADPA